MALFKNFKCPNGLPPDECEHPQQLVINLSEYFKRKQEMRKKREQDAMPNHVEQPLQQATVNGQRQRTRG